ncbi:TPA: hypothetical protein ACQ53F_002930 [Legionella pneumophila]
MLSKSGTEFITAGGGGAFLHPTHSLPDSITDVTWREGVEELQLAKDDVTSKASCYPSKDESRNLAKGNNWFFWNNFSFSFILGVLYGIAILLLSIPPITNAAFIADLKNLSYTSPWISILYSPSFFIVLFIMIFIGWKYALKNDEPSKNVLISGIVHGLLHFIIIFMYAVIFMYMCNWLYRSPLDFEIGSFSYILTFIIISFIGGLTGSVIWGKYLSIVSYYWGLQSNDAFSSLGLTSYKNFLRLHFKKDTLTIYPIGLKNMPSRKEWVKNNKFGQNQYEPQYVLQELDLELIETPIVISKSDIS